MEKELSQKIEELAGLLLTPQQIGDLLGLSSEEVASFQNPYSETGRMYRKILAEKARDLHEKTLKLSEVGSPTAIERAAEWLSQATGSIE
jgi:hypothetical protein